MTNCRCTICIICHESYERQGRDPEDKAPKSQPPPQGRPQGERDPNDQGHPPQGRPQSEWDDNDPPWFYYDFQSWSGV